MRLLRDLQWLLVLAGAAALAAIRLLAPNYLRLQSAPSAAEFRRIVHDSESRYLAAAAADVAFAACYGALALSFARTTAASRVGAGLVVLGAASDIVENSLLMFNVAAKANLTERPIAGMRAAGVIKFAGIATGMVAFFVCLAV